jgi:hypothetical protein
LVSRGTASAAIALSRERRGDRAVTACGGPLWVGVGLAVFQQVTGINAVICYSERFSWPEPVAAGLWGG